MVAFSDDRQNFRFPLFDDDDPIKRNSSPSTNSRHNQQFEGDFNDYDEPIKRTSSSQTFNTPVKKNRQRFDNSMYKDEPTSSFLANDTTPRRSLFGSDERELPVKRKRSFDQVRLDKTEYPVKQRQVYDDYSFDDEDAYDESVSSVEEVVNDDFDTTVEEIVEKTEDKDTKSKIVGSRSFKPTVLPQSFVQKRSSLSTTKNRLEEALSKPKSSYILFEPSSSDSIQNIDMLHSDEMNESTITKRNSFLDEELAEDKIFSLDSLEDLTTEERGEILRTINDVQASYTSFEA